MRGFSKRLLLGAFYLGWCLLFFGSQFFPDFPARRDSTEYLTIAAALARGEGFLDPSSPDPVMLMLVPSGWPLFLALIWALPGIPVVVVKILILLLTALGGWLAFRWLETFLPTSQAFAIGLAFSATPMMTVFANSFLTESLFIPLLFAGMLFHNRASRAGDGDTGRAGDRQSSVGSAGPALWAAQLCWLVLGRIRLVGIFFWAVLQLWLLRRRAWWPLLVGITLMLGWYLLEREWHSRLPGGIGYGKAAYLVLELDRPLEAAGRIAGNVSRNLWDLSGTIIPKTLYPVLYGLAPMSRVKRLVAMTFFCAIVASVVFLALRRRSFRVPLLGIILTCTPVMVWGNPIATFRYMLPFFPIFLGALVFSIHRVPRLGTRTALASIWTLLALCLAGQVSANLSDSYHELYVEAREEFSLAHHYIREHAPPERLILSHEHYYTWLSTGRPTLHLGAWWEARPHEELLSGGRSAWAILGPENRRQFSEWKRSKSSPWDSLLFRAGPYEIRELRSVITSSGDKSP